MIFGGLITIYYGIFGGVPFPPPGPSLMITENNIYMTDESGNFMITE